MLKTLGLALSLLLVLPALVGAQNSLEGSWAGSQNNANGMMKASYKLRLENGQVGGTASYVGQIGDRNSQKTFEIQGTLMDVVVAGDKVTFKVKNSLPGSPIDGTTSEYSLEFKSPTRLVGSGRNVNLNRDFQVDLVKRSPAIDANLKAIAGKWVGQARSAQGINPLEFVIDEDGKVAVVASTPSGTVTGQARVSVQDGKLFYESGTSSGTITLQDDGRRLQYEGLSKRGNFPVGADMTREK